MSEQKKGTDPNVLLKRRQDRQRASEKLQLRLEEAGIKRVDQNDLLFSTIPFVPLINQKNYYTEYLRKDDQFRMIRNTRETVLNNMKKRKLGSSNGSGNLVKKKEDSQSNTPVLTSELDDDIVDDDDVSEIDIETNETEERILVIHPGSETIKIGWSNDIEAQKVVNMVAYKNQTKDLKIPLDPKTHVVERKNDELNLVDSEYFREKLLPIKESFKERMKYYKRRMLPNSSEQCRHFNRKGTYETIDDPMADDNDTIFSDKFRGDYVVGEDVLKIGDLENWIVRSPFTSGSLSGFNDADSLYNSQEEVLGDIELLLRQSLKKLFSVQYKDYGNINVMLVLPNIYSKAYIETMVGLMITRLSFKNVAIIQEALASSFGAGLSSGCIVDIGSRAIHISCVEEGVVVENSRVELDYGMNDIVRLWGKCLIDQQMQWGINLSDIRDFWTIREIFKECATFDDEVIGIKTSHTIVRDRKNERNEIKAKKYLFKVWDEVMTCPMGLFYPEIFNEPKEDSVTLNEKNVRIGMLLDQLSPSKAIHRPLFEDRSGRFEGYLNESTLSALQKLEEGNIELHKLELKDVLEIISEIYYDNEPNTAGGGGAKRAKPSKFNTGEWLSDRFQKDYDKEPSFEVSNDLRRNMTPLDTAIVESIAVGGSEDVDRMEKFWSNVCVVGGGGCLSGIENMLLDRLHISRSNLMSNTKLAECIKLVKDLRKAHSTEEPFELNEDQLKKMRGILESGTECQIDVMGPSDLDPLTIGWKGGCVYAKLRVIEEMWVSKEDWELLGGRSIRYGGLFIN